jgi:GTPase
MTESKKKNPTFTDLTDKVGINPNMSMIDIVPCIPEHCYQTDTSGQFLLDTNGNKIENYGGVEVRIATIGNVDAGKSTTVGVLKSQKPDNGKGKAREGVFRHKHEIESGRTSDVGNQYIKYNNRLYSLSDLAGHEGYLRTTIYGLVSTPIDWAMLLMSANQGVQKMTREHLAIAYSLNLSMYVVVTKVDIAPENVFIENMKVLKVILKKIGRTPVLIKDKESLKNYYNQITLNTPDDTGKVNGVLDIALSKKFVPIFCVSNVTLKNMDLLQTFVFNIRPHVDWRSARNRSDNTFVIDKTYSPKGVGIVLSGTIKHGYFEKDKTYMLGPFGSLDKPVFHPVTIRNIRDNTDTDIGIVVAGFSACFNITTKDKSISRSVIQKGMVLCDVPQSVRKFKAIIKIMHHPSKICIGYEPHLHCGGVKETMRIVDMDREYIKAGESTNATLEFKRKRCFVQTGDMFLFREGNTRGSGKIIEIIE